jgi:hypothetical protein
MVITKLVEWAGKVINKVVYITGREVATDWARLMVYKVESVEVMGDIHIGKLQELLTYQGVRDTREQVKEYVAGVATDMVYIIQMEDRLIYLYEKYENIIMIEVYVMQMRKAVSFNHGGGQDGHRGGGQDGHHGGGQDGHRGGGQDGHHQEGVQHGGD